MDGAGAAYAIGACQRPSAVPNPLRLTLPTPAGGGSDATVAIAEPPILDADAAGGLDAMAQSARPRRAGPTPSARATVGGVEHRGRASATRALNDGRQRRLCACVRATAEQPDSRKSAAPPRHTVPTRALLHNGWSKASIQRLYSGAGRHAPT